jgi:hypothetical protein
MRLLKDFRKAEQKGLSSVVRRVERAREEWVDAERRIRQRMRVYPQKLLTMMSRRKDTSDEILEPEIMENGGPAGGEDRKPIVSIHGHDVPDDQSGSPAA